MVTNPEVQAKLAQYPVTEAQVQALDALVARSGYTPAEIVYNLSYSPLFGCLFLRFAGMMVGIEADGYTHS